jgi:Uncharacterized protein conserved in bacteria (DUF2252)
MLQDDFRTDNGRPVIDAPEIATKELPAFSPRRTRAELYAIGEKQQKQCPWGSHAAWKPPEGRPDPIQLVEEADKGRIPRLVPLRHGRMLASPFTFYRGAALSMTADLATTRSGRIGFFPCH